MAKRSKKLSTFEFILFIIFIAATIYTNLVYTPNSNNDDISHDKVLVYFIDVGQADSILIRSDDKNILIDAGNNEDGPLLVEYFKSLGINSFEHVFATHPHEDHIGGMDDIIRNFSITKFYMPDVITTTKTFTDLLDALEEKDYKYSVPKIGEQYTVNDIVFETIYIGSDQSDLNSTSIVLRMDHGNNSFLFTGDTTSKVEKTLLDKKISADILKVAHHGSNYANTKEFLEAVLPKYAIIEVGKNNSYNHPNNAVLDRLNKLGVEIHRTDIEGTIIVKSDGNDFEFLAMETKTNG